MENLESKKPTGPVFRRTRSGILSNRNWLKVGDFFEPNDPKKAEWTDYAVIQEVDSLWTIIEKKVNLSISKNQNFFKVVLPGDILASTRVVIYAELCKLGFTEIVLKKKKGIFGGGPPQTYVYAKNPNLSKKA